MMLAPFQLKTIVYPEISIKAYELFDEESQELSDPPCVNFKIYTSEENYFIGMSLQVASGDSSPYDIHITAVGHFLFETEEVEGLTEKRTKEMKIEMIAASAPNMLYSSARDYLATLTARAPWGAYVLPSIYISDSDIQLQ